MLELAPTENTQMEPPANGVPILVELATTTQHV